MSSIVYQIDKKSGAKYAFESVSYWDKEKKQPRSKRKYLGKVDPDTGEIIPSRGKTAKSVQEPEERSQDRDTLNMLHNEIGKRDKTIGELRRELDELTAKYEALVTTVQKIRVMVEPF